MCVLLCIYTHIYLTRGKSPWKKIRLSETWRLALNGSRAGQSCANKKKTSPGGLPKVWDQISWENLPSGNLLHSY